MWLKILKTGGEKGFYSQRLRPLRALDCLLCSLSVAIHHRPDAHPDHPVPPHPKRQTTTTMGPTHPTVLLFGDLTDAWVDGMDYVFGQATTTPWLQSFLDDLFSAFKAEVRGMDSFLQESFGPCSNFQELAQKYRRSSDQVGLVHAMLLYAVRAVLLLECVSSPLLLITPTLTLLAG